MKKICFVTTISLTLKCFILPLTKYIHENTDWDISFICSEDDEFAKNLPEYIHYYPVHMERGISIAGVKAMLQMKEIFKREKFDIIQYSTPNAAFLASIAAKWANTPVRIYHLMGFRFLGSKGCMRKFLQAIEKITCKMSTNIECVSESNRKMGIELKIFNENKAVVIWNGSTGGVDINRFDYKKRSVYREEIRKKYLIDETDFVFGYVGRIVADKGVNELLEAFERINNAKLFMIGSNEGVNSIDERLYKNSIKNENVIYTGSVENVEKYFSAIDVLLLPSYREGFGNVVIEAAAMGTPAIISNIPGPIDAVIPDYTAKVVEVKNVDDLHKAMLFMMDTDYVNMGVCAKNFVVDSFENNKLNEYILRQKKSLINELS